MPFTNHIDDPCWTNLPQRIEGKKIHQRIQDLEEKIRPYLEARVAECILNVLAFQMAITQDEVQVELLGRAARTLSQRAQLHQRFREQSEGRLVKLQQETERFAPLADHLPDPDFSFPADEEFQRANNGVSGATFLRKGLGGERYVIKFQDLDQTEIEFLSTDLFRRLVSGNNFSIPMGVAQCCFPSLPEQPTRKLSTAKTELHRKVFDDNSPIGTLSLLQLRMAFINHRVSQHSNDNVLVNTGFPCFFEFMPGTTLLGLCQRPPSRVSHISTLSRKVLEIMFYQFGYIGGLDFLVGNFDRFLPRSFGEGGGYHPSSINAGNILLHRHFNLERREASISSISLIDNTPAFRIFFSTAINPINGKVEEGHVALRRKFTLFIRGDALTLESLAERMFQELASEIEMKDPIIGRELKRSPLHSHILRGLHRARWDLSSARVLNQCANFFRGIGDITSEKTAVFLGFLRKNVDDLIMIHEHVAGAVCRPQPSL